MIDMRDNNIIKTENLEQEEKIKHFSSNLARIIFSILVLFVSKDLNVINIFMGIHLISSIIWFFLSLRFPMFQSKYPFYWLIPAGLDILNCLMIIYVTGSAYSSWILSLPFMSALSAMDKLRWRGLFTGFTSSVGFAVLLILVQLKFLPFIDIWKINYRPHSWSLVVQASLLNAGVIFFIWHSLHKISITNIIARENAEQFNNLIITFLKNLFQEDIIEKIQNTKGIINNYSPIVVIDLKTIINHDNKIDLNEIYDLVLPICNQFHINRISNSKEFLAFCKLNSSDELNSLKESIDVTQKIFKEIQNLIYKKNLNNKFQISSGIVYEKIVFLDEGSGNSVFLLEQTGLSLARKISLFNNSNNIYVNEKVYEIIKNSYKWFEEGSIAFNGKLENVYSIKYEE